MFAQAQLIATDPPADVTKVVYTNTCNFTTSVPRIVGLEWMCIEVARADG